MGFYSAIGFYLRDRGGDGLIPAGSGLSEPCLLKLTAWQCRLVSVRRRSFLYDQRLPGAQAGRCCRAPLSGRCCAIPKPRKSSERAATPSAWRQACLGIGLVDFDRRIDAGEMMQIGREVTRHQRPATWHHRC
jgi:hypothetical protein